MDIHKITNEFYSKFCCATEEQFSSNSSVLFVEDSRREETMKGYGCKFVIYAFISQKSVIVAYSPRYSNEINELKRNINLENARQLLENAFKRNLISRKLFEFTNSSIVDTSGAKILDVSDYKAFEEFFLNINLHLDVSSVIWLKDYFQEKVKKRLFCGYFVKKKLVCVSDAPDMPYLDGVIQHTGVNTLKEFRKRGYAKKVCYLSAKNLLSMNICPQWETDENNIASINLAKSIGYKQIGYSLTLEE
jgi:RimJ/RimL family protein N-acetyltransferase